MTYFLASERPRGLIENLGQAALESDGYCVTRTTIQLHEKETL